MRKVILLCSTLFIISCSQENFEIPETNEDDQIQFIINQDLPKIVETVHYGHAVPGEFPGYGCEGLTGICAIVASLEGGGISNVVETDLGFYNGTNAKMRYQDTPFDGMTELEIFEGTSMSDEFIQGMGLNSAIIVPGVYPIVITEEAPLGELTFELIVE